MAKASEARSLRARWFVNTREDSADIQLGFEKHGQKHSATLQAEGIGQFIALILLSAQDAHAAAGKSDPVPPYRGTIPPLEPATISLLNPGGNRWGMVVRIASTDLVFDISNLDLEKLGQALVTASASKTTRH